MIHDILAWFSAHPEWLGAGIFVIAFAESLFIVGIVVPGVVMLFGTGSLAGSLDMHPLPLLLWAAAGAIAGDLLSYFIGRWAGHEIREWPFMQRHRAIYDRTHTFFEKYGILAVIGGRFIGAIRPVMPAVAGAAGMGRRLFISADIASAAVWAPAYLLPGFYAASYFA